MTPILGTSQQQLGKLHKTLLIKYGKIEQWLVRQTHNLKVAGSTCHYYLDLICIYLQWRIQKVNNNYLVL